MGEPYFIPDKNKLSNCCSAPAATEICDGISLCSRCKEWADFEDEEEYER